MRTVTLEVSSREESNRRLLRAFEGQQQGDFISFETPALLFKVLTHALLKVGILQKTKDGQIVFPFDAVHVNFLLKTA
jgi:hypothetical protein